MISHSRNLRKKLGWKCVLGIRDTIVLSLLQNPQRSLPRFRKGGNPRGSPAHLRPQGWQLEGRGGLGALSTPVQRDRSVFSDGFQLAEYRGT